MSVDLGFILPSRVMPKDFKKMVFAAFQFGAQHKKGSVESKPAWLLVVSLDKALDGMPPSSGGRQVVGQSN